MSDALPRPDRDRAPRQRVSELLFDSVVDRVMRRSASPVLLGRDVSPLVRALTRQQSERMSHTARSRIWFTVSLLIGDLAFGPGSTRDEHVKVAVLTGSFTPRSSPASP